MIDFSGAERLAREHPNDVVEFTITRGAHDQAGYTAAVTVFAAGGYNASRGHMVGTGSGSAGSFGEAVAHAVSDFAFTAGEDEADAA